MTTELISKYTEAKSGFDKLREVSGSAFSLAIANFNSSRGDLTNPTYQATDSIEIGLENVEPILFDVSESADEVTVQKARCHQTLRQSIASLYNIKERGLNSIRTEIRDIARRIQDRSIDLEQGERMLVKVIRDWKSMRVELIEVCVIAAHSLTDLISSAEAEERAKLAASASTKTK